MKFNRNYYLLLLNQFFRDIGDGFFKIAGVWLLVEQGGSGQSTAFFAFVNFVPGILFGILVGPLLQRYSATTWLFGGNLARACVILPIILIGNYDQVPFWLIFLVTFLQSLLSAIDEPVTVSTIPKILEGSAYQKGYSLLHSIHQIVMLFALAFGGLAISVFSTSITLLLAVVMFITSAVIALGIMKGITVKEPVENTDNSFLEEKRIHKYINEIRSGFKIVNENPSLKSIAVASAILNFGIAPFLALLPIFVETQLMGTALHLSFIEGAVSAGALLMGIVLSIVSISRQGALFIFGSLLCGLCIFFLGIQSSIIFSCLLALGFGISQIAINIPEAMAIQKIVSENQQAKVYSLLMSISFTLLPIGFILSGWLSTYLNAGIIISAGGGVMLFLGIYLLIFTNLVKLKLN